VPQWQYDEPDITSVVTCAAPHMHGTSSRNADDQSLHALPALQTLTRSAFTDSGLTPRQEQAGIHHASCPPCCAACPELRRCDSWANAADPHSQLDQGPPCSTWQAVGNLLRVRTLVLQHIAKQDEEKTTDFLCDIPYCLLFDLQPVSLLC
jgi:hypothetical protein